MIHTNLGKATIYFQYVLRENNRTYSPKTPLMNLYFLSIMNKILKKFIGTTSLMLCLIPMISPASMVSGTLVRTPHGLKAIETLEVGDKVLTYNEQTSEIENQRITFLYTRIAKSLIRIKVANTDGQFASIDVTAEHPFYAGQKDANKQISYQWQPAENLKAGTLLLTQNKTPAYIVQIEKKLPGKRVFNIEVAQQHNYFASTHHLLVHNPSEGCTNDLVEHLDRQARELEAALPTYNVTRTTINDEVDFSPEKLFDDIVKNQHDFSDSKVFFAVKTANIDGVKRHKLMTHTLNQVLKIKKLNPRLNPANAAIEHAGKQYFTGMTARVNNEEIYYVACHNLGCQYAKNTLNQPRSFIKHKIARPRFVTRLESNQSNELILTKKLAILAKHRIPDTQFFDLPNISPRDYMDRLSNLDKSPMPLDHANMLRFNRELLGSETGNSYVDKLLGF